MKILIAYDGSPSSEAAVHGLSRAGLPAVAEVCILSVINSGLVPPIEYRFMDSAVSEDWAQQVDELERGGRALCKRLMMEFPMWSVRAETIAGSPAEIILQRISGWNPDMLVLGTHGRGAVARLFVGSVARKMIGEAECTVHVGRTGVRESGPVQIVVGVDGSPESVTAVDEICNRKWPTGTMVRVVAVFEPLPPTIGELAVSRADELREVDLIQREQLQAAVKQGIARLSTAGLTVDGDVLDGLTEETLLREATERNADVLFVGARTMGRTERALFGLSQKLVTHALCSVEVVYGRKSAELAPEIVEMPDVVPM